MKKLRLGIIGAGWPGQMHAIAARNLEQTEIYACADVDTTRRAEFEKEYEPHKAHSEYHELLGDAEVEAVIICLPNHLHFPATLAALEAGKHVLCEKLPTLTAAEMNVLRGEAVKRGLDLLLQSSIPVYASRCSWCSALRSRRTPGPDLPRHDHVYPLARNPLVGRRLVHR